MKPDQRYKLFAPLFVVIALFYVVFLRLPYDMVVVEGQLRTWASIVDNLMAPYILASIALGTVGVMYCLRARREQRPLKGLVVASICYFSGVILFFGMLGWWMVSSTWRTIFRAD